jgi:predicted MFS family arabinose efflux permease
MPDRAPIPEDSPETLTHSHGSGWAAVSLLWVVAVLNYLDRQLVTSMAAPIKSDLGITDARFGLFSSVFLWIYGIVSPVAGFAADRWGRRRVIIFSLLVWSSVTWATGHVASFGQMVTARALMGISEAFYIPAAVAMIVDYHRGSTRSLATGLHLSGAYTGAILGGLGGWLSELEGWRFGFNMFGVVGVFYAMVLGVLLREPKPRGQFDTRCDGTAEAPVLASALRSLLRSRGFVTLLAVNALVGAAFWTVKNWLPVFFNTELGFSLTRAGWYGTLFFNASAFSGMLAGGVLADRWSRRRAAARALVPGWAMCLASPCLLSIGFSGDAPWVVGAIMAAGIAQGMLDSNLMPTLCLVSDPRLRATGYGMLNLVGTLAGGAMTWVGGVLKDASIPFARTFQAASALILAAGLLLFTVRPSKGDGPRQKGE